MPLLLRSYGLPPHPRHQNHGDPDHAQITVCVCVWGRNSNCFKTVQNTQESGLPGPHYQGNKVI